ncbi:c-type cytochrome [Sphingomonas sp.]|uniref:c-type cytochrome n=1 Tax=Sphingomonas sp. TaxID=28214 RepID=UPI000DB1ED51|nr:c-type cytochrome [Sphingomonas sp.]PZU11013.1 MAG: hypothetical protein DI605_05245 [Sphingomonas sp.]
MRIALALALMGSILAAGCQKAPGETAADTEGAPRPDVDKNLTLDTTLVAHQCSNCHAVDYMRVGPPIMSIRAAFPSPTPGDVDRLKQSILKGSVGKWGEATMPPQTQVTPEQANAIVAILLAHPPAK